MEEEIKTGIHKFQTECERLLPGIKLVIPVRPTQGAFLVSFSHGGQRTYGTISEDSFAVWGESNAADTELKTQAQQFVSKLLDYVQ